MLLVKVTRHYDSGRDCIQNSENSYPDHQPLQFISFCASLFDNTPDPEQRDEAGQQKHGTDEQVDNQRCQHKAPQVVQILVAYIANPGYGVPVH